MTTSPLVPGLLPVAIDDHPYLCDPEYDRTTVQVIRTQADQSFEPGEQSLTPLGLWRRSQESWHHGAGQPFLDGRTGLSAYSQINADPERFRTSRGVDPWTHGQIGLLPATVLRRASVNTNLLIFPVGSILYIVDGNEVYWNTLPFNYLTDNNSGFETSVAGWTAGANTTIARSTAQFHAGVASMSLTATGSGDMSAATATGTAGIPVIGNRFYSVGAQFRAATTGRTCSPFIDWYDAAGVFISSTAAQNITDSNAVWSGSGQSAASPANAAYATIRITVASAGAAEVHYVDSVNLTAGTGIGGNITWTAALIQAGQAAQTPRSATTDGYHVWAALGTSGIHRTTRGATSSTADVPGPGAGWFTLVAYVNGRLLAAGSDTGTTNQNVLFEITDPLGTPTATVLWTHPNTDFVWTFISQGRNVIYAGGNSGGNAEVYRITLDPTTTALSAPTHCSYLPDGETIHALQFYAGGIVMGTGKGLRLGQADAQGNIDYGPLIATIYPVLALEPQDRYCWFSYTNPDATSTGLGRVDLGFFTDTLTPAWAPDLFALPYGATTVQGSVLSIASWLSSVTPTGVASQRWFAVSGVGFYSEDAASGSDSLKVASGFFSTGGIRYGTTEPKTMRALDIRHHALPGGSSVSAEMNRDSVTWETIGSSSVANSFGPASSLGLLDESAASVEFRFTLNRVSGGRSVTAHWTSGSTTLTLDSGTVTSTDVGWVVVSTTNGLPPGTRIVSIVDTTHAVLSNAATVTVAAGRDLVIGSPLYGPEMVRWTSKVLPTPSTIDETFTLTLHMKNTVDTTAADGQPYHVDVPGEIAYLKGLEQSRQLVTLQLGSAQFTVYVVQSSFKGTNWNSPLRQYAEGMLQLQLQTVRG